MNGKLVAAILTLSSGLSLALASGTALAGEEVEEQFVTLRTGDMEWRSSAEFPGLEFVLVEGNPGEAGPYVLRAKFAPGAFSRPHFHSEDRHVTILSGVWYAGTDDSFDKENIVALHPGDYMKHPAGGVHYDGAKDVEAIVQITGIGPVTTTRVPIAGGN